MASVLKTVLPTAAFVVLATVATSAVASMVCLLLTSNGLGFSTGAAAPFAAILVGAMGGFLFSLVSLPVAALTMPPTIGLAHQFKLPRPLVDCVGGALAALVVVAVVVATLDSMASDIGGGPADAETRLILNVCALLGGSCLGYLRHALLVRSRAVAPQGARPEEGLA